MLNWYSNFAVKSQAHGNENLLSIQFSVGPEVPLVVVVVLATGRNCTFSEFFRVKLVMFLSCCEHITLLIRKVFLPTY